MLQLLRQMRADMGDVKGDVASVKSDLSTLKEDVKDIKSDMHSLRADVASDLLVHRKEVGAQIVGLRRAVMELSYFGNRPRHSDQRIGSAGSAG